MLCELEPGAREAAAEKLLKETGGVMVPPYDHLDVIAGQGTVALELLKEVGYANQAWALVANCARYQVPHLDAIIVPIGGGGMVRQRLCAVDEFFFCWQISGISVAARGLNPTIRIIGAEPLGAEMA